MLGLDSWLGTTTPKVATTNKPKMGLPLICTELIGREHSGKTALKTCYIKGPLAGPQLSGLELAAIDPRLMTGWMIESLASFRDLTSRGLFTTLDPEVFSYHLYRADEPQAILQLREVIGQVLTNTTSNSDADQQKLYETYMSNLSRAEVLQVVIGCPPSSSKDDLERFQADLLTTTGYLREALKLRANKFPVAVQILLTKIDVPFADADEAREAMADDRLRAMLNRLVMLVEGSSKVGMAAIFPVSPFGFGTMVQAEKRDLPQTPAAHGLSQLSAGEPEFLLKPGASPEPFNLTAVVWWSIMAGLMMKPADCDGEQLASIAKLMAKDLEEMNAWVVPLKTIGK